MLRRASVGAAVRALWLTYCCNVVQFARRVRRVFGCRVQIGRIEREK